MNYKVKVCGKMVAFDNKTINVVYGMLDYENDGYQTLMDGKVDYDEIMKYLCIIRAAWKLNMEGNVVNFESKYLCFDAYDGLHSSLPD